jgi:pimeloyl-ACP methyl ester carboxylesterase
MSRLFPAVRKVVVPGAGHWVHADAPDVVIAELLAFADQVDARRH